MQFDPTLLMMLAVMAVLVFFMIRNNRKRKKDAEERKTKLVPGVSVMTSFGVYGKLISVDTVENTAELEIAPKTVIKVHVQTLATVVEPKVETIAEAPVDVVDKKTAASSADAKPAYGIKSSDAAVKQATKKPATSKPAAKKPAASKPAAKKPAAKKPTA